MVENFKTKFQLWKPLMDSLPIHLKLAFAHTKVQSSSALGCFDFSFSIMSSSSSSSQQAWKFKSSTPSSRRSISLHSLADRVWCAFRVCCDRWLPVAEILVIEFHWRWMQNWTTIEFASPGLGKEHDLTIQTPTEAISIIRKVFHIQTNAGGDKGQLSLPVPVWKYGHNISAKKFISPTAAAIPLPFISHIVPVGNFSFSVWRSRRAIMR